MKLIDCNDYKHFLKEKPKKNQSIFLLNKEVTIDRLLEKRFAILLLFFFYHSQSNHQKQNVAVQALPLTILGNIAIVIHAGNGHILEITQAQKMIREKRKLRNLQVVFLVVKRNINAEMTIAIVRIEKNLGNTILSGACRNLYIVLKYPGRYSNDKVH